MSSERPGGRPSGSLGWGGAYHTVYWIDPGNDLTVIYLTQVFPASGLAGQAIVERMIYEALK
ncbi:MAG: hypothetical protein AAGG57_03090 [Pseudomonadota bacterium]